MIINFLKFHGTGNDFVMIDGRDKEIHLENQQIKDLCDRRFGVGADGVIILRNKEGFDFEMDYSNADGSRGMCGNGGRCAVQFARKLGLLTSEYRFWAIDGAHVASFDYLTGWINLKLKDVDSINHLTEETAVLNTGTLHYVKIISENLNDLNVYAEGKKIRNQPPFKEQGINVNFVEELDSSRIFVRTYERGVENETLSCGTGVTAAALLFAHNDIGFNRVDVKTLGGELAVDFVKTKENYFTDIWLCGPAEFVFDGQMEVSAKL